MLDATELSEAAPQVRNLAEMAQAQIHRTCATHDADHPVEGFRQDFGVKRKSDYFGFGLGGLNTPVVSYAPRPILTAGSSLVIMETDL
jgi:hypothetical protein